MQMRRPTRHMSHGGRGSRAPEVPRPAAHAMAGVGLHREGERSAVKYGALLLVISKEELIFCRLARMCIKIKSHIIHYFLLIFSRTWGTVITPISKWRINLLTRMHGNKVMYPVYGYTVLILVLGHELR